MIVIVKVNANPHESVLHMQTPLRLLHDFYFFLTPELLASFTVQNRC